MSDIPTFAVEKSIKISNGLFVYEGPYPFAIHPDEATGKRVLVAGDVRVVRGILYENPPSLGDTVYFVLGYPEEGEFEK